MSVNTTNQFQQLSEYLEAVLGPQLKQVIDLMAHEPGTKHSPFILIPKPEDVDLSMEELSSLVARTSNAYAYAARLSGMARAEKKLAEGRYKRRLKQAYATVSGTNQKQRDANAEQEVKDEALQLTVTDALVSMADAMEEAARVASESARKLLDKRAAVVMGNVREQAGHYREEDYG